MADRLKIGVVGLGMWGQNHPLVYDDYARSELAVVCDLNEERARSVAEQYNCDWTTSVEELAASDVPAFSVATPDHTHYGPVSTLLQAGKHVLVEKPLTTDLDEAKKLTDLAEQSSGFAMVDYHLRWDPQWSLVKETVESGQLGNPVMGYIRLSDAIDVAQNWLAWAGKSGPQWFLFPHTMDLMRWIIAKDAEQVYAQGHRGILESQGVDAWDCMQALISFGDCSVTFETSWIVPNSNPSVIDCHATLYGEAGKVEYDQDFSGLSLTTEKHAFPWVPLGKKNRYGQLDHYMYAPIRYFVDCVLDGREPECTFADGLAVVAMIHAVMRSLESGRPVAMDEVL